MKKQKNRTMRFLAALVALLLVFAAVPLSAIPTEAAAKPKIRAKVTVKQGKTKAVKLTKNGYTINSVKVTTDDEDIVTVKANKNKVKFTGMGTGITDVETRIRASKDGIVSTFTYITTVTVTEPEKTDTSTETPAENTTETIPVTTPDTTPVTTPEPVTTATVNTQDELNRALADTNIKTITIGASATTLTIASAVYADKNLIVDAPKASITNQATFKEIEIKSIAPNTWTEYASGNSFVISATSPIRFSAPASYNITSIRFTGASTYGTSYVTINGGVTGLLSVEARHHVNISVIGTTNLTKLSVTSDAKVGVNCADTAIINSVEATDAGSNITIGTTGKSRIPSIKVTRASSGAASSSLSVTTTQSSSVSTIEAASPNLTVIVTENDSSSIGALRITDSVKAFIYGNSKNQMYLDLNNALVSTNLTINTEAVRIDLGYGLVPDRIITNTCSSNLTVNYYTSAGNRETTVVSGKNVKRITNNMTVSKANNSTNQIVATFTSEIKGLQLSNFRLYGPNGLYLTSATTSDNGRTYILTVNTTIVANEKYTVEITGLDTNVFVSSTISASFSTDSTAIRLDKTALTATDAQIGKTEKLIAEVLPNDGLSRVPNWFSSDTAVADVDKDGVVTYKGVGTATITAYYGLISATCKVTVTSEKKNIPYVLAKFSIDGTTWNVVDSMVIVKVGGGADVSFTVEDLGSDKITSWEVYSSNDKEIGVVKTAGASFRVNGLNPNPQAADEGSAVVTLTVNLASGQVVTKTFYFYADLQNGNN